MCSSHLSDSRSFTELLNQTLSESALGSYLVVGNRLLSRIISQYTGFPSATKVTRKESNIASPYKYMELLSLLTLQPSFACSESWDRVVHSFYFESILANCQAPSAVRRDLSSLFPTCFQSYIVHGNDSKRYRMSAARCRARLFSRPKGLFNRCVDALQYTMDTQPGRTRPLDGTASLCNATTIKIRRK